MARVLLQIEMKRRGLSYRDLTGMLNQLGMNENEANVRNKIGRGKFTAAFFMICLRAMDVNTLDLTVDEDYLDRIKSPPPQNVP